MDSRLGSYRQLAETAPSVYLPDLARTLNYLALLTLDKGEPPRARSLLEEALNPTSIHAKPVVCGRWFFTVMWHYTPGAMPLYRD